MTTTATPSLQNPLQGLADALRSAGEAIGRGTPLGDWLMSDVAAPVVLAVTALLAVLLLVRLLRRRRRAGETESEPLRAAPVMSAVSEPAPAGEPGRTHPEALAMLYDAPSRREPVLRNEAEQAPAPAPAEPAPAVALASASAAAGSNEPPARENASLRLMVSAVDRLLQRVESQQAQIHALLDELKAQSSALVVQGERVLELEARVSALASGVPVAATASASGVETQLPALEQAIALAARGAGEQELVSQLGLSAAEARLINLVHGQAASDPVSESSDIR